MFSVLLAIPFNSIFFKRPEVVLIFIFILSSEVEHVDEPANCPCGQMLAVARGGQTKGEPALAVQAVLQLSSVHREHVHVAGVGHDVLVIDGVCSPDSTII